MSLLTEVVLLVVVFALLLIQAFAVVRAQLEESEAERRRLRDVLDAIERIDEIQLSTRAAIRDRMSRLR